MKTFGLFMILWLIVIISTFAIWKGGKPEEMIKMLLATQFTYIFYRLIKEEEKN